MPDRGPSGTGHDTALSSGAATPEGEEQRRVSGAGAGVSFPPAPGSPADPPVAVPGPASAPECVCAEINIRHCPVHGQGEPGPASVSPAEPPRREILPLVIADLTQRIAVGTAEYGSALAVESPNDSLRYAYEEALDLALYLRQELERRAR